MHSSTVNPLVSEDLDDLEPLDEASTNAPDVEWIDDRTYVVEIAAPCEFDVFVAEENLGTEEDPDTRVMAMCDGDEEGCGWEAEHLDDEGDPHEPGAWWITSSDMFALVRAHQTYAEEHAGE